MIRPDYVEARRNRGQLYESLERFGQALADFDQLQSLFPDDPAVYRRRGLILQQLGRMPEAIASFSKAVALNPEYAEAHNNLGNVLAQTGRLDEAVVAYERALALNPLFFEAVINLGRVRSAQTRFDDAADQFRRAAAIQPDSAAVHLKLGEALLQCGRQTDALAAAEVAARLQDQPDFPRFELGVLFGRCGRTDDARTHIFRYLEQDPADSKGARQVLAALELAPLPARASAAHLQSLYRERAGHWTDQRGYCGHEQTADAVRRAWTSGPAFILDAGCGTGIMGPLLRPLAHRLEGVDFSSDMLAKAQQTCAYDALHEAELLQFLAGHHDEFDVIAAAAVLIHFGDLAPVFSAVAKALCGSGLFVFTAFPNHANANDVAVAPLGGFGEGGCFVHGQDYIRRVAAATGFHPVSIRTEVHELDNTGAPVNGLVVVLRQGGTTG